MKSNWKRIPAGSLRLSIFSRHVMNASSPEKEANFLLRLKKKIKFALSWPRPEHFPQCAYWKEKSLPRGSALEAALLPNCKSVLGPHPCYSPAPQGASCPNKFLVTDKLPERNNFMEGSLFFLLVEGDTGHSSQKAWTLAFFPLSMGSCWRCRVDGLSKTQQIRKETREECVCQN